MRRIARLGAVTLSLSAVGCTAAGAPVEQGEEQDGEQAERSCHREIGPDAMLLPYDAFGPQAMAVELIGFGWWQWDAEGHGFDEEGGEIWVVVHDDLSDEQLARRFPVSPSRRCDNRFVTRREAIAYIDRNIDGISGVPVFEQLVGDLRATQRLIARQGSAHQPSATGRSG